MSQHHDALIYTMVIVSAADREMTDAELRRMGQLVTILPVFPRLRRRRPADRCQGLRCLAER